MIDLTSLSRDYPHNADYMARYVEYQQKYATRIRESDKCIVDIIRNHISDAENTKVLDIGCSTGNLLLHLHRLFPKMKLVGGDLSDLQIENCLQNPDLEGIDFRIMDVTNLVEDGEFDFVIANAILYCLEDGDFSKAAASIAKALKPGGALVAFDWFHPWKQELTILEQSGNLPGGHTLHFRSYDRVRDLLGDGSYESIQFNPFAIPIDLPQPAFDTDYLETYTVRTADGERLQFRGIISQPWNHMVARRM